MKKIISLLILVVIVVTIVFIAKDNKLIGVWECSHYSIYNLQTQEWVEQGDQFTEMFEMEILPKGIIILATSGNNNEGTYMVNKDTLKITIRDNKSSYLIEKDKIILVNHPRAKIEYTKRPEEKNNEK